MNTQQESFNVIVSKREEITREKLNKPNQIIKLDPFPAILRACSLYFKSAFSTGWITKKNDMIIFNKPNITPTVFEMILK